MNTRKLYFLIQCVAVSAKVACLDADGNSVSRWAIFKFPRGSNYAYWDPTTSNILPQSDSLNSSDTGALALTMSQLWDDKSVGYTFYNDEIPNSSGAYNFSVGHSKGVWMWDEQITTAVIPHRWSRLSSCFRGTSTECLELRTTSPLPVLGVR
jgi:Deoxyribonuclease II